MYAAAAGLAVTAGAEAAKSHQKDDNAIDVEARWVDEAPQLIFVSPPCAGFAPRPLVIDVDARFIDDVPALPAPDVTEIT